MNYHDVVTLIAAILGSGGFFGGMYLLLKLKPETGSIVVKSAEDVVVMQGSIITELRKQIADLKEEIHSMREDMERLRTANAKLTAELARFTSDNRGQRTNLDQINKLSG